MPNSIALANKYLPILDEKYKRESLTARLDAANGNVQFIGANAVKLFKTNMDGLANYSRNAGFVQGSVTGTWETLTLEQDRGVSLSVDAMDNEETLGLAFGTLVEQFMRLNVVPEIDAYRFAKYSAAAGTVVNADITVGTTDCPDLIDTAEQVLGDDEVPVEGRILYVSETFYHGIKSKITRYLANENGVNREVEMFNGMPVIRVPESRFNTAVTLYDGTEHFGFVPTNGGYKINFMIIHPTAVAQVIKHAIPRIWLPNENINADAYKFDYRIYHDCWVLDNKVKGIYLHRKSTANS